MVLRLELELGWGLVGMGRLKEETGSAKVLTEKKSVCVCVCSD